MKMNLVYVRLLRCISFSIGEPVWVPSEVTFISCFSAVYLKAFSISFM